MPLPSAPAGTLIWAQRVDQPALDPPGTIWRILYHSRSRTDADIAVSGFAVVPLAGPPAGGRPVYAWAHGSVGQADRCAPSHAIANNLPPLGGQQIGAGAVIVATDYEGLGTPGEPTYLDGVAEAHAVLDSVPRRRPAARHRHRRTDRHRRRLAGRRRGPLGRPAGRVLHGRTRPARRRRAGTGRRAAHNPRVARCSAVRCLPRKDSCSRPTGYTQATATH